MKLLLVNHEYSPIGGGAATATREIARNLAALEHEVVILTGSFRDLPSRASDNGVSIYRTRCVRRRIDRSNFFEMFTFLISALVRLPRFLRKHRPEGLITFFSLPSGLIGLTANVLTGLPYVVSLRGGDVPGLVPELDRIHKLLTPIRHVILRRARAVVANSEGLRQLSADVDPFPVHVIPNGVDTDFFRPGTKPQSNRLRLLFVGRFHRQKNLQLLLEQVAQLSPGTFELHLVGDGREKEHLLGLAQERGVAKAIIWHSWLSRPELLRVYQAVDCLVNPSNYEGLPNVVLEAMACELPVIASRIPGHETLVLHEQSGLLFDLDDRDGIIRAVVALRDVDLRSRLGAAGRARAISEFSWRTTVEKYLGLLNE